MDVSTIIALIPLVAGVCSIVTFFVTRNNERYRNGSKDGELHADIQYIKRRSDDMLLEQKETNKTLDNLSERVTRVEESTKQAHKRLDEHIKEGR